jgi:hypothetical protein
MAEETMPVLEPRHDAAHPVESDAAWSESYYFNAYDPVSDSGFFTRIGIRTNEGTRDVGLSVWLPGGELAEYRCVEEQPETGSVAIDSPLAVGGVRYQMLEAMKSWRITAEVDAPARMCARLDGSSAPAAAPRTRPVRLHLDVRFDALSPAVGTDGQSSSPRTQQASAAAATTGKGHFEQAGRWTGTLVVDGVRHAWDSALGNRDRSWGPRRWGGPSMWRWFSINIGTGLHFGGIRLGTAAGDLHRGWVFEDGRVASIREWRIRTELAGDGLTQRVVHLEVEDKEGRCHPLRGDVLRVADIGRAGGTVVNEGLTRWTYTADEGATTSGYGIAEYLHQVDGNGRPATPVE